MAARRSCQRLRAEQRVHHQHHRDRRHRIDPPLTLAPAVRARDPVSRRRPLRATAGYARGFRVGVHPLPLSRGNARPSTTAITRHAPLDARATGRQCTRCRAADGLGEVIPVHGPVDAHGCPADGYRRTAVAAPVVRRHPGPAIGMAGVSSAPAWWPEAETAPRCLEPAFPLQVRQADHAAAQHVIRSHRRTGDVLDDPRLACLLKALPDGGEHPAGAGSFPVIC